MTYAHTPETRNFIGEQGGGLKTVKGYVIVFQGEKCVVAEEVNLWK